MTEGMTMHDHEYAFARLKTLERNWEPERQETARRRMVRYVTVSVERLRKEGAIKLDATFIPRRVADSNIRRELAPYIAYITQSRDVAKFRAPAGFLEPVEALEREFTGFAQYDKWQLPFFQVVDGAATHGWAAIETVLDETKPGRFRNRYVSHDNLLFAPDVCDIQESPVVAVAVGATVTELAEWVEEYDFDGQAVEEVREKALAQEDKTESKVRLLKVYFKDDRDLVEGKPVVYLGWHSPDATRWLKRPEPLNLGRASQQAVLRETEYPIEVLLYTVSEDEVITATRGRVFMDEPDQEACTQMATAFVNRAIRASYILCAREGEGDEGPGEKQLEVNLGDGKILPPVKFFSIEPPDASLLNGMMTIISQNANEIGQVNFAVTNRKDSRKTATEVQTANQQQAMLNSVQVALLSTFLRNVWRRCWEIARSQVLQGTIQSGLGNWELYYGTEFALLPAGDVDVIRRAEMLQRRKQDWPVMQTTGAAQEFLLDIIRESYPEQAEKYLRAIEAANRKDNLLKGMRNALLALAVDPATQGLKPEVLKYAPQLQELVGEYQAVMTPPGQEPPEEQAAA